MSQSHTRRTTSFKLGYKSLMLIAGGLAITSNVFADPKVKQPGGVDTSRPAVSMTAPQYYAFLHSLTTGSLSRVASRANDIFAEREISCHTSVAP